MDRTVEVIDERPTGETLLDEALRMMSSQQAVEKLTVNSWIDLLSGKHAHSHACDVGSL
jgi:golgi phosphoprotein 3